MRKIRQSKFSSNRYWTDILWQNYSDLPSSLLTGLLSWWTLNEASGNRADSTSNSNTMIETGSVTGTTGFGNMGNVSVFPGGSPATSYLSNAGLWLPSTFSMAFWIKGDFSTPGIAVLAGDWVGFTGGFDVGVGGTSTVLTLLPSGDQIFNLGSPLINNAWNFIAVYADSNSYGISANGSAFVTAALSPGSYVPAGPIILTQKDSLFPAFAGDLVGLGVWSRVLTTTEISKLYNSGNGQQYPFILNP